MMKATFAAEGRSRTSSSTRLSRVSGVCRWLGLAAVIATPACNERPRADATVQPLATPPSTSTKKSKPATPVGLLDVTSAYPAIDLVGARRRMRVERATADVAHSPPEAFAIAIEKGAGFGGACWKNKAGNEGEAPGDNLSGAGYRKISFWARGARGGEVAEFRAGGMGNVKTRYSDSFDVTAGKIKLGTTWTEHTIYVMDADLSSVMTVFCALFYREDNADGAQIYIDDIQYSG